MLTNTMSGKPIENVLTEKLICMYLYFVDACVNERERERKVCSKPKASQSKSRVVFYAFALVYSTYCSLFDFFLSILRFLLNRNDICAFHISNITCAWWCVVFWGASHYAHNKSDVFVCTMENERERKYGNKKMR